LHKDLRLYNWSTPDTLNNPDVSLGAS
jgi:hypothetical protein